MTYHTLHETKYLARPPLVAVFKQAVRAFGMTQAKHVARRYIASHMKGAPRVAPMPDTTTLRKMREAQP